MTAEQKKTLSDSLYVEYLVEFNKAKEAFRACFEENSVCAWNIGREHMQKADKINLMRLALI